MFELDPTARFDSPVLLAAFDGWASAGSVGITAAEHIAADGPVVASFDPDRLFDFRVSRPTATLARGALSDISWPEVTLRHRSVDERDLLVLSGPEPNWNWRAFAESVGDLAGSLGVVEQVSLGGIPWAAPHTRPTVVVTTASRPDLVGPDANPPEGEFDVPAAIALVLESNLNSRGIPASGFWARVPHYIGSVYYPGVVALVERVSRHTGVDLPLGSLVDDAAAQRRQLASVLESRTDARQMVERYERAADARGDDASAAEIAEEIERFLREQTEGL
jgi:hypothetical protein